MKSTEAPILVEQTFEASITDLWEALSVVDKMRQWFFNNIPAFEPVVGFETRFDIQVEDRVFPHLWKLTEVVPRKRICYDWSCEGYPGRAIVLFELLEGGDGSKLRLTSTAVEDFPDTIAEFKRESGVQGWNYFVRESLKGFLDGV